MVLAESSGSRLEHAELAGLAGGCHQLPSIIPLLSVNNLLETWCDNQKAQCPLICLQQPGVNTMTTVENDCDPVSHLKLIQFWKN